MNIGELKQLIADVPDYYEVGVCVETPAGYVCPDGCVIGVKRGTTGIDFHGSEFLLIPNMRLRLTDSEIEKNFP